MGPLRSARDPTGPVSKVLESAQGIKQCCVPFPSFEPTRLNDNYMIIKEYSVLLSQPRADRWPIFEAWRRYRLIDHDAAHARKDIDLKKLLRKSTVYQD